jgi:uncharacterized protein with FMN-binding domain
MRRRNWRGTTLFLSIFAILGATLGLKFYSSAAGPALTSSLSAGTTGTDDSGTDTATAPSAAPSAESSTGATTTPTTAPTPASTATKTVNGDAVQTRFGPVQVAVTFSGTRITKLNVLQVPQESGRDMEITSYSVPVLTQEVMSSQSANVDTVGGATYTSEGYLQSVQSAIDKLG